MSTAEIDSMARALQPELERAGWTLSLGSIAAVLEALDFQVRAQAARAPRTDTQRLDALEKLVSEGDCPGIINDDNGHWAVSGSGVQNVPEEPGVADIHTTFFVEAKSWRNTIREAIDAYLEEA